VGSVIGQPLDQRDTQPEACLVYGVGRSSQAVTILAQASGRSRCGWWPAWWISWYVQVGWRVKAARAKATGTVDDQDWASHVGSDGVEPIASYPQSSKW